MDPGNGATPLSLHEQRLAFVKREVYARIGITPEDALYFEQFADSDLLLDIIEEANALAERIVEREETIQVQKRCYYGS